MSTPVDRLLDRLDNGRRTGPGRWIARCPAHEDHRPSLSVREGDDGRVLLYCFAGCGAIDVIEALGLDWSDLFPERLDTYPQTRRRRRRVALPIPARDALELVAQETLVVEIIARRLSDGEPAEQHVADLRLAASRIAAIRSAWEMQP